MDISKEDKDAAIAAWKETSPFESCHLPDIMKELCVRVFRFGNFKEHPGAIVISEYRGIKGQIVEEAPTPNIKGALYLHPDDWKEFIRSATAGAIWARRYEEPLDTLLGIPVLNEGEPIPITKPAIAQLLDEVDYHVHQNHIRDYGECHQADCETCVKRELVPKEAPLRPCGCWVPYCEHGPKLPK